MFPQTVDLLDEHDMTVSESAVDDSLNKAINLFLRVKLNVRVEVMVNNIPDNDGITLLHRLKQLCVPNRNTDLA